MIRISKILKNFPRTTGKTLKILLGFCLCFYFTFINKGHIAAPVCRWCPKDNPQNLAHHFFTNIRLICCYIFHLYPSLTSQLPNFVSRV